MVVKIYKRFTRHWFGIQRERQGYYASCWLLDSDYARNLDKGGLLQGIFLLFMMEL